MKLRCIIVDDEFLARQLIEGYAQKVPFLEVVALCENALEAMAILQEERIDLLFPDVNMPELSGINFIKSLTHKPEIILTTAYSEHALEGYQLDVIEYLLKPIYFERFLQAVNKAKEQIELKLKAAQADLAKSGSLARTDEGSIFIKTGQQRLIKINLRDIRYVESLHEYVRIYLDKESHVILHSLKGLLDILPSEHFVQVHRSYIINFNYVTAIEGNTVWVQGTALTIGKNFREEFINRVRQASLGTSSKRSTTPKADDEEEDIES